MKPGAIISLLSSNCSLSNLEVKKKLLQFLLTGYFTTKILKEAAQASLLVHPWATLGPGSPSEQRAVPQLRSEQGVGPDNLQRSLPTSTSSQSLVDFQKLESICNEKQKTKNKKNKNKESIPGVEKLKYYCELFCTVLSEIFLFFLLFLFFLPTIANVNHSISLCLIYLLLLPSTLFNA